MISDQVFTWGDVAVGAGDGGHALGGAAAATPAAEELGEAEVGDVGLEHGVEQDVVGLDVPVYNPGRAVMVEVAEPARRLERHSRPGLPAEVAALAAVEHLPEEIGRAHV